jgi:hypothetical protein
VIAHSPTASDFSVANRRKDTKMPAFFVDGPLTISCCFFDYGDAARK